MKRHKEAGSMLNSGEFKKLTIAWGLSLCIFSSAFASDNLIVPEVCVERAHEMGIFKNSDSVATTRKKLEISQAPWQVFEFENLYQGYANTLSNISSEMENNQSPLFSYLNHCQKNEKTCHGYFQPDNPFHIRIFCDREILRSSIETIMGVKDARFDKCVNQPFDEWSLDEVSSSGLNYDPKCFKTTEKDGKQYLSNKAHTQIQEIRWVDGYRSKMIETTINTIKKSLIPEGVAFILQKTIEEFDDLQLRNAKINDLNVFYRTSELIQEFEVCCQNSSMHLPAGDLSLSYFGEASQNYRQSIDKPITLVFKPNDYLSVLIFQEADRQYWRDKFSAKSPIDLTEAQRLAYFEFLQQDRLFPLEYDRTFADFAQEAKKKPREEFKPKTLSATELKAYQEKLGYVYEVPRSQKLQDYIMPREQRLMYDYGHQMLSFPNNKNKLIGNFIFDPEFEALYMEDLHKWNNSVVDERFENHKKIFYPRIFKSFLQYQFVRTAHAKIIRELQKKSSGSAKKILSDFNTFYIWADNLTCQGFEYSYCTPSQADFRKKKLQPLYEKIITENIVLEFSPDSTPKRTYIYTDAFLNSINQNIQSINKYCWEIADPKAFKSDPDSFTGKLEILDQKMQDFYSIPRFEELLGQNDFLKAIKLNPIAYAYECVTKGYAFGGDGYPSSKGHQLTSHVSGYAAGGMVPVYTRVNLYDYNIREVFIPSIFKIEKSDLEDVEDEIEERIEEELVTLKEVYRYNEFEEYKKFLEESATVRLLALIDYAIDNPSAEIGKYLCELIRESDENEYTSIRRREAIVNIALIATSVATVFVLPGAAAGVSVLYEAGTAIAFSAVSIGYASYNIKYYNDKNNLTDMAVLTQNIKSTDAIQLHHTYNEGVSAERSNIIANVGLLVIVGARPLYQSTKYIQKLLDKEYQLVRKTRQLRVEEFVRRSPVEKDGFYVTQRMEDFLFDYKKVTNKQFDDFFTSFERGEAEGFVRLNWEKELGRFLPVKKIDSRPLSPGWNIQALVPKTPAALKKPFEYLAEKNSVYLQPYWYKLKPHINKYFLNHFNTNLRNEARLVDMIENAKNLAQKTGREIFSEAEIKAFAQKMKYFKLGKDGNFYRIADTALGKVIDRFMMRSVSGDAHAIRKYLEPMIEGELLKKEEWDILLKSFSHNIESIDDCKSFLKAIKYAKKDYSSLWEQIKNAPELFNGREILRPYVFEKRANIIIRHIDEFYDIAKYIRSRNNVRMVDDFRALMNSTGKSLDELEAQMQKRYPDLSLKKMFETYEHEKVRVLRFKEASTLEPRVNGIRQAQREFFKDEGALLLSYKDQFLKQEKNFNAYFHKQLIRGFQKEADAALAYQKALNRTQIRKSTEYECSLPDSKVRKEANRVYQQLAGKISLGTNFMGYMTVHGDKEKDAEWWTRMGYEMAISYYGGILQAKLFTGDKILRKGSAQIINDKTPAGPLNKTIKDLASGIVITAFDGLVYASVNEGLWDNRSKFEREFAQIIYEAGDVQQTVNEYFSGNPEIEERILKEYEKVKLIFDELELKNSKGTMVDSDMEDAFVRAGLIDNVLYSDMELKNRELGKDYIYHDLIENGYLDADLYRQSATDEEFEQQLFDLMTDISYQNLYSDKSGVIKYPLLDPIKFSDGDIDSMEFQTGSEAFDRMLFHTAYDVAKTPIAYAKNNMVYRMLCNGRFLPGNMNVALALATHIVYKSTMDPLKFYLREQATGR